MERSGLIERKAMIDWQCLPRPRQREWDRQVISPETRLLPDGPAEIGFLRSRLQTRTLVQTVCARIDRYQGTSLTIQSVIKLSLIHISEPTRPY